MQSLVFDNAFTRQLPADSLTGSERRQIRNALFSRVEPTPVVRPYLMHYSPHAADLLGLDAATCNGETFLNVFAGNQLLPGMDPHATCYGGHQFGNWAGQLGDGRAINLGEVKTESGHLMLQLKGAGKPLSLAPPTAWPYCARPCANTFAPRLCFIWVCRPLGPCR